MSTLRKLTWMTVFVLVVAACGGGGTGNGGTTQTTSGPPGTTQPTQPATTPPGATTTDAGSTGTTAQPSPTGGGDSFFVLDGQRIEPDELHMCPGLGGEEGGDDDFRVIAFAKSGGQDLILQIQIAFHSGGMASIEILMAADSTSYQVSSTGTVGGSWDAGSDSTVEWDGTRLTGENFDFESSTRTLDSFDFDVPSTASPQCT